MLILHHDYPSAGSLRAVLALHDLAERGADVTFHGLDVLGVATALPATLDDLQDWARHRDALAELGWHLPRPRRHPATLAAHVVERACPDPATATAWRLAAYRAHWVEGRDLGDWDVLVDLATGVGMDAAAVGELVADRVHAAQVRRQMIAVRGDGVGGVPVLDVHGTKVSPFMASEDLATLVAL
jgi:predicted DsbA family dithiol-disulfide isomerase